MDNCHQVASTFFDELDVEQVLKRLVGGGPLVEVNFCFIMSGDGNVFELVSPRTENPNQKIGDRGRIGSFVKGEIKPKFVLFDCFCWVGCFSIVRGSSRRLGHGRRKTRGFPRVAL